MANRKMTLSKTKLAQALSASISSRVKSLGVAAAILLSASNASALSLGSFEVASNLDQPLNGTIELRVAAGDDLDTLSAVIASAEDFESLGIDYPDFLKDFSLTLDTVNGEQRLRVTSNNVIIKEPFIHFLVRVEWSGGSFLREYTALIDPPVYAAGVPTAISEPRQVGTDQSYQTEDNIVSQEPAVVQDSVASEEPLIKDNFYNDSADTVEQAPALEYPFDTLAIDASYGPVESGESLSVIAQDLQRQFPDLSIYQIMKVLFEENQSAFIGANINGLLKGSILKIGDLNAIRAVNVSESKSFYFEQIADWNPQLLQPSGSDSINVGQDSYNFQDDSSFTSDTNEFSSEDSFQVGASAESNDYVSSDQGDTREGEVLALRQEVTSLQSSLASSDLEKQELNERISLLEGQLADMNRLAELSIKSAELASLENTLAEQNDFSAQVDDDSYIEDITDTGEDNSAIDEFLISADETVDELTGVTEETIDGLVDDELSIDELLAENGLSDLQDDGLESVIGEAGDDTDAVTSSVGVTTLTVTPEESFLDKVKSALFAGGLWKILVGLGAILAAGAAVLFFRRRRVDEEFEVSMLSIESNSHSVGNSSSSAASASMSASHTASMASEAITDKETSFLTVYSDSDAVVQADEVDPVAEADVYIAYGRDEQAEEVLLDGVVSHPERIDIKQKLLSLYHKRQNVEGFERIAEELYSQRSALTGDIWQQVCEMGKEVAPSNPLFELSGDDLNIAIESDSELLLEGDDISEVALDADLDESVEPAADEEDLVDHLDESLLSDKHSDLEEELTIEDQSEMVVGSLAEDESIQLINFDDGRSEVSELDDVEIDALELSGDIPASIDLSKESSAEVENISLDDDDQEDLLEFNFDQVDDDQVDDDEGDDLERAFGELQAVSDLEIDPDYDEARTQYELAKVFVDLGDEDGARKILVELVANKENSTEVLSDAQELLDSINL
jgi:pilus assembly protein FimV